MKISVIIPCFNEEKYLDNCLTTLSTQTLIPDEVIICDNNSTDNSVNVAKKYSHVLPLKIVHQPIKGILPTVEKAWRSSSGDIIVRTDADASFPKDWLKLLIKHFTLDPDLSACGGYWVPSPAPKSVVLLTLLGIMFGDLILPLTRGFKLLLGPNTAIRRTAMDKINGYVTDNPANIDDQLISYKLSFFKLKYRRFSDCWNYHSSRRYQQDPKSLFIYGLSSLFPKLYLEKST